MQNGLCDNTSVDKVPFLFKSIGLAEVALCVNHFFDFNTERLTFCPYTKDVRIVKKMGKIILFIIEV